ncbi:hypothetical protein DY240_18435 [Jiangella rhizosphaerae]|uniref:Uncharacterized protein n=1 Tax=Jiangella rhizosphaerae TaxID=2293569 RepID=A0A418KN27_9ACTN|nr:hypothetical protein DY240_18435 [Jiangella rhizosphaerae]
MAPAVTVAVVTDTTDLTLPVTAYLLSEEDLRLLDEAHTVALERCFERHGVAPPELPSLVPSVPVTHTERRYGLADPELAAASGYHLGDDDGEKPELELSAEQELVLFGPAEDGMPVADGGCSGEAVGAVGGDLGNPEAAQRVDVRGVTLAMKDPRVREAFAAWSACMAAHGHDYATPWDPPNDPRFTGPSPGPGEIDVAVDDVACKEQTNVVGVWYAVDAALQTVMIGRDADVFAGIAAERADRLDRARAVLAARP